jgi:hypothetical protein
MVYNPYVHQHFELNPHVRSLFEERGMSRRDEAGERIAEPRVVGPGRVPFTLKD